MRQVKAIKRYMKKTDKRETASGFTLIELLVVIAIIALLMAILMPALARVRKQGKRSVCLSNTKQLLLGWTAYAETFDGKMVNGGQAPWANGQIKENFWCTLVNPPDGKYDWDRPFTMETLEKRVNKLKTGALWPYLKDEKIYRCPEAKREMHRTYSITNPMNSYWSDMHVCCGSKDGVTFKNLSQIRGPQERIVFVEEGYPSSDAFEIYYTREAWCDVPQAPHVKGANFGYADGHAEFWKWMDTRSLCWIDVDWANPIAPLNCVYDQPGNKDLQRVQIAAWGKLAYTPQPTPPGVIVP